MLGEARPTVALLTSNSQKRKLGKGHIVPMSLGRHSKVKTRIRSLECGSLCLKPWMDSQDVRGRG